MAQLPLNLPVEQRDTKWKSILDPVIAAPMVGARILTGVLLASGTTAINHGLARPQQGWFLTDIDGAATVYRSAAFNDKTLTLTSSAAVRVNIGVF